MKKLTETLIVVLNQVLNQNRIIFHIHYVIVKVGDTKNIFSDIEQTYLDTIQNNPKYTAISNKINEVASAVGSLGSLYQSNENKKSSSEQIQSVEEKMNSLISMGFANRKLNKKLLEQHQNNMDKVIQDLLKDTDNDWFEHRQKSANGTFFSLNLFINFSDFILLYKKFIERLYILFLP